MLWKGSERRIGKVRLVKESRFGTMFVMIHDLYLASSAFWFVLGFGCAVVAWVLLARGHDRRKTKTYNNDINDHDHDVSMLLLFL